MKSDKELYRRLRILSLDKLWNEEVTAFNRAAPGERTKRVAVIRAVGVVFSESGTLQQRAEARAWLLRLLRDPSEKIRRYAMAALPKLGAGEKEETELLILAKTSAVEREKKYAGRALDKIGGAATLSMAGEGRDLSLQTEQKVKAGLARKENPSSIRMNESFPPPSGFRVHLRCRKGLEGILRDEIAARMSSQNSFRISGIRSGLVVITPEASFSLSDLYTFRCFASINFVLASIPSSPIENSMEALAAAIASPLSRALLTALTEGSIRYRLDFISKGHQRGAIRQVVNRAFALCPDILNDARQAPWSIDIHPAGQNLFVELRPRLSPDPRFYYRKDDVAASSHPPLAACMARLAGEMKNAAVWDPFCGSGQELIERALLGGVHILHGTDISPEAIAIAKTNFAAANLPPLQATFTCCDFRDYAASRLARGSLTLMITNPPMGRRVRIAGLRRMFEDLFAVATVVLKPGGQLILANPVRIRPTDSSLTLQYERIVDLGGFDCRLEKYVKTAHNNTGKSIDSSRRNHPSPQPSSFRKTKGKAYKRPADTGGKGPRQSKRPDSRRD